MKSIGVPILASTTLPENEAEVLQKILAAHQSTAYLKIDQNVLALSSQADLDRLNQHHGKMVQIVADGGPDAGDLLTAVHNELVRRKCCY